jgi:hypothetical protein
LSSMQLPGFAANNELLDAMHQLQSMHRPPTHEFVNAVRILCFIFPFFGVANTGA